MSRSSSTVDKENESIILYLLELKPVADDNAKWYVGITQDFSQRLKQHHKGNGALWVKRNTLKSEYALGLVNSRYKAREFENQLTLYLMDKFGIDSTRGGDYLSIRPQNIPDLSETTLPPIIEEKLIETGNSDLMTAVENGKAQPPTQEPAQKTNISLEDAVLENLASVEEGDQQKTVSVWDGPLAAFAAALEEDEESRRALGENLADAFDLDDTPTDRATLFRQTLRLGLREASPDQYDAVREAVRRRASRDI